MPRDARELDKWIEEHPRLAFVYTIGISVLICEVAFILDQLARRLRVMETGNDQMVGVRDDEIVVLLPKAVMTKEEAVRHACWLLVLAGKDRGYVAQQMLAIEGT